MTRSRSRENPWAFLSLWTDVLRYSWNWSISICCVSLLDVRCVRRLSVRVSSPPVVIESISWNKSGGECHLWRWRRFYFLFLLVRRCYVSSRVVCRILAVVSLILWAECDGVYVSANIVAPSTSVHVHAYCNRRTEISERWKEKVLIIIINKYKKRRLKKSYLPPHGYVSLHWDYYDSTTTRHTYISRASSDRRCIVTLTHIFIDTT